ncbi:hypothetical protein [Halorubrum yunnanense]|uniref:Secreted protein n=1 Tax=Halorubrum yunnanense TaxID=1526162 RepID=A0ABD5YBA8_9EURY|nr:hypothetical protein [Halorubrum yunnanense]
MDRRNSTRHGPVIVLVICVVVVLVATIGVAHVSAETHERQPLNITNSGETKDLFSFENNHTISNVEIAASEEKSADEYKTLYINLVELQNADINVSEVTVRNSKITNGQVITTNKSRTNGEITLKVQIKQSDTSNPIQIDSVQLGGYNSSDGKITKNIQYRVAAANTNSTSDYEKLEAGGHTKNSTEFDFVDGSIRVRDQATTSTNFNKSSRTSSGVTVSKVTSSVNSKIILINEENDRVVGYKSQNTREIADRDSASLNTTILGGDISAYLIPNSKIGITKEYTGNKSPDGLKQTAIAKDRFQVYLGTVQFNSQEYESGGITNVSVATTEVRDTAGLNTPYVVSVHPITADGEVMYEKYIGYSDVLVGVNDGLSIPIRNARGSRSEIWHSNRFVATIRLAQGQTAGEPADLNSTNLLPNSDIAEQFIHGGVSDSTQVHISNVRPGQNDSNNVSRLFNETGYNGNQIYSGEVVGIQE